MRSLTSAAAALPWLVPVAFAAIAWFLAASRMVGRWGPDEAAVAVGVIVALAVFTTLWRWGHADRRNIALASARCPRCSGPLRIEHEHAAAGSIGEGIQTWECDGCGYRHGEALTCPRCRP